MLAVPENAFALKNPFAIKNADYYFNRANEKAEQGEYYGAIADYTKAIEIDPNYRFKTVFAKLDFKKVEKRCAYGREASMSQGKIGIIENYELCLKFLKEIGATSLDIPFKVHQKCENLLFYNKKVEPYLYCVSNETNWEPPTKYSRDEIVKSYKKYSCEYEDNLSSAPAGFWDGNSCVRRKVPDVATYKGKTYTASRICSDGETMRWQTIGFRRKLEELGCMTDKEHEAYWRVAKQRQRERDSQALQDSIKDLQKVINPPTIHCSSYGTRDGYNTTCTQY